MASKSDWFIKIVRIGGASFPGTASLVQFQAELDAIQVREKLQKLEDPISYLHDDVPELSKEIYKALEQQDSVKLDFDDDFYSKYGRALAVIESQGLISTSGALGKTFPLDINLIDPSFIMYICSLSNIDSKMEELFRIVDSCDKGKSLNGDSISQELILPRYVIKAVFQIFESKGYGFCSGAIGSCKYTGKL